MSQPFTDHRHQSGLTLPELLVAMVVIAIALSGLVTIARSMGPGQAAKSLRLSQAVAVAQSYIEEISALPYVDPTGANGESLRADFDDIFDYDGLSEQPPHYRDGTPMAGSSTFAVSISVVQTAGLGPAGQEVPSADAALIVVSVDTGLGSSMRLHKVVTR